MKPNTDKPTCPPVPTTGKEDTRDRKGCYQSDKDWMRRGGRNDTIKR